MLARAADAAPATERLAMAEEAVAVGLKTIQTIRPAFDAFYNTLDAEQKEMLDGGLPITVRPRLVALKRFNKSCRLLWFENATKQSPSD